MQGIKAQVSVVADTETEVYEVPASTEGTYDLTIRNTSEAIGQLNVWFTTTTTSSEKMAFDRPYQGGVRIGGLALDAGQKIIIKTSTATVATLMGIEGDA